VRRRLAERIDPAFMPRPLIRVERLPRDDRGKLALTELQRLIGEPRRPAATSVASASLASSSSMRGIRRCPGHFPGHPVVPGVLLLAEVESALRERGLRVVGCTRHQVRRAGVAGAALRAGHRARRPRRRRVHDEAADRARRQRDLAMRDGVDAATAIPRWRRQRERGSPALMEFIAGVALRIGRPPRR
jgi:hypothetical protein